MTETTCSNCGKTIPAEARFCPSCGQDSQAEGSATGPQAQAGPSAGAAAGAAARDLQGKVKERFDSLRADPANQQLAENVKGYLGSEEVKAAVGAAVIGVGITLAAAVVLALLTPNTSLLNLTRGIERLRDLGLELEDLTLLREILLYATGTSLAGLEGSRQEDSETIYIYPILFALIPVIGTAFGVRRTFPAIASRLSPRGYVTAVLSVGATFAVLMAAVVLLGARWEVEPDSVISPPLLTVFLLSLLWGSIGALIGLSLVLRSFGVDLRQRLPMSVSRAIYRGTPAVTTLVLLLALTSLMGTLVWTVQSVRDAADARHERSLPASIFDSVLYSGDLGIRYAALGSLADLEFTTGILYSSGPQSPMSPVPVFRGDVLRNDLSESFRGRDRLNELTEGSTPIDEEGSSPSYNLFSFKDLLGPAFLPFAVALIGLSGLAALYAGFLTASRASANSRGTRAAWGAMVGPVWAVLMVALNALSENVYYGTVLGESILISALIGGAGLGALGGLLTSGGQPAEAPVKVPTS